MYYYMFFLQTQLFNPFNCSIVLSRWTNPIVLTLSHTNSHKVIYIMCIVQSQLQSVGIAAYYIVYNLSYLYLPHF